MARTFWLPLLLATLIGFSGCSTSSHDGNEAEANPIIQSFIEAWATRYPDFGTAMGLRALDGECVIIKDEMETYDLVLNERWKVKTNHALARDISKGEKAELTKFLAILVGDGNAVRAKKENSEIPFYRVGEMMKASLAPLLASGDDRKDAALERFRKCVEGQEVFPPFVDGLLGRIRFYEKKFSEKSKYPALPAIENYLNESPAQLAELRRMLPLEHDPDWAKLFTQFSDQVRAYDQYIRKSFLQKTRLRMIPRKTEIAAKDNGAKKDKVTNILIQRFAQCQAPDCLSLEQYR